MSVTFKIEGLGDVTRAFDQLADEIGDRKAQSRVLVPAARQAIMPVLTAAQQNAPIDSGGLRLSLQVEARRPTKRDRRSKYIGQSDSVIAMVTTASGQKLAQMSSGRGLSKAKKRLAKMGASAEQVAGFTGIKSDARAIAQEFGTSKISAQPYLRPAMESNAQAVVSRLGEALAQQLNKYRKNTR
jgi:HK97 gp10 family phage protein